MTRAEIELLRGDIDAATERWRLIRAFPAVISRVDFAYESARRAAEAALWAGRPGDALEETRCVLALYQVPDLTITCGRLLTAGMRACAHLAVQVRARRDQFGAELYISPKTAGVHVSNILRKLGVSGRVQAAGLAERAGLLPSGQP